MSFPSLPNSVDRYVRQTINTMLGRTGQAGDQVVTFNDLSASGLLQAKPNSLTQPADPGGSIGDILEPVVPGELPDTPTTPTGLATSSSLGAVILTWNGPTYKGHAYTEVWRAQIDNVSKAQMIHESPLARWTDVTGNTQPHFYWLKHVNNDGLKSQFNQVAGTLGKGNQVLTVEDLVLSHPEILQQPFTVINQGDDDNPEWYLALNGNVLINGSVNISQLASGEMAPGTRITIGESSVEMGTSSDGTGYINISGKGGLATSDYMTITEGQIFSYIYVPGIGHVPYKEVKRMESGSANSGQQVKVPAYFRTQPTIHLYPRDVSIYNPDYAAQAQKLEIWHTIPEPHPTEAGAWLFTPYVRLVLADGTENITPGWTYDGSSNSGAWEIYDIDNLVGASVFVRCASFRRLTSTSYNNRQVTVSLWYRIAGTTTWAALASTVVSITKFATASASLTGPLVSGDYDIRVEYQAADRSGTFTDGSPTYEYTQQEKTGTLWNHTLEPLTTSNKTYNKYIALSSYQLSGWTITQIEYRTTMDLTLKVRDTYSNFQPSDTSIKAGTATIKVPDGEGGHNTYSITSPGSFVNVGGGWEEEQTLTDIPVNWTDTSRLNGNIYGRVEMSVTGAGYDTNRDGIATAHCYFRVKTLSATVFYRRETSVAETQNNFYMDAAAWNKGALDISVGNAVVTWNATASE